MQLYPIKFYLFLILIITMSSVEIFPQKITKDMRDMAETERAFSATAVKEGFRDSFIKFFADDGIGFLPAPEIVKAALLKTPPSNQPRTIIFKWQPYFCDIALGGDMGYTTGPLIFEDVSETKRPPRHGMYFSVWQKQSDGSWKVVVDLGVDTPQAVAPIDTDFKAAKNPNGISKSAAKRAGDGSFSLIDKEFSEAIEKSGIRSAYDSFLSDEFRIHRDGFMPIVTKDALKKYFEGKSEKFSFKQMGGKVAALKDFAFTYGSFQLNENDSPAGYYVHVWRRNKAGNWKLVLDVNQELPKKQE